MILGLLKNRLLIEDLVRRHPEILDERITAPIVICGLPRTGTTHLHNLMSADPGAALPPLLGEPRTGPARGRAARPRERPIPRVERTALALSFLDVAMPYFNRMHEMTVEHTHEEIQLLAIDFSSMLFETTAPMPLWRDDYLARDQRPSYAYLVKVLKVLQWLRGGTRWVLKIAPAPRAVPRAGRHLPRRHVRGHPPRPGLGDGLHDDDGRLLGPADP